MYHVCMQPYYEDSYVRLFLGDCRDVTEWSQADFLLTDPPFGRDWKQGSLKYKWQKTDSRHGIKGDESLALRDWVLESWGDRPAAVFGDLMLCPPKGTKLVCVYQKPHDAGRRGTVGGFRRDAEAIYLTGKWGTGIAHGDPYLNTSVLRTSQPMVSGARGLAATSGHPHAKPVDILEHLMIAAYFPPVTADPFAGSGSTLVAAKRLGLKAVGVEVDERYAERAANRLSDGVLL